MIQKKKKKKLKQTRSIQAGFSFLELTVVFAVIALLGAFVVPNLFRAKQGAQRKEFLSSFESLLKDAVLKSIVENKMHQIFIDIAHEVIQTREYNPKSIEMNEHKKFARVVDQGYVTEIKFPKRFAIKDFVSEEGVILGKRSTEHIVLHPDFVNVLTIDCGQLPPVKAREYMFKIQSNFKESHPNYKIVLVGKNS